MSDHERLMTCRETAVWLRERGRKISASTVLRELNAGTIPGRRIGRAWVTSVAELRAWLGIPDTLPPPTPIFSEPIPVKPQMLHRKEA